MTTALDDPKNVVQAFYKGKATSYIVKPIAKKKLLEEIEKLGLDVKSSI
jgi:two-component system chemotaxis response regulator CheY